MVPGAGLKLVSQMTLMTMGLYNEPTGTCMPSFSIEAKRNMSARSGQIDVVRVWRAPCKGAAFQWVQAPPGNRSSRKQSEQSWR